MSLKDFAGRLSVPYNNGKSHFIDLPDDILYRNIIAFFHMPKELLNYMLVNKELYHGVINEDYECNIIFNMTRVTLIDDGINILDDLEKRHIDSYQEDIKIKNRDLINNKFIQIIFIKYYELYNINKINNHRIRKLICGECPSNFHISSDRKINLNKDVLNKLDFVRPFYNANIHNFPYHLTLSFNPENFIELQKNIVGKRYTTSLTSINDIKPNTRDKLNLTMSKYIVCRKIIDTTLLDNTYSHHICNLNDITTHNLHTTNNKRFMHVGITMKSFNFMLNNEYYNDIFDCYTETILYNVYNITDDVFAFIHNVKTNKLYKSYEYNDKNHTATKLLETKVKNNNKLRINTSYLFDINNLLHLLFITSHEYRFYVVSSSVLKLINYISTDEDIGDIDIAIKIEDNKDINYFMDNFMDKSMTKKFASNIKIINSTHIKFDYEFSHKQINIDLFIIKYPINVVVKDFHLPCVRAFYNIYTRKMYCFPSFIHALITETISYHHIKSVYNKSYNTIIKNIIIEDLISYCQNTNLMN